MKSLRIIAPALGAMLLCCGLLLPSPAGAESFFAFTVSETDWLPVYGEGPTAKAAEKAAIRSCGGSQTCIDQVESAATPICFAIADSPDWLGWASRTDYAEAIDVALKECRDQSSNCRIISLECRR